MKVNARAASYIAAATVAVTFAAIVCSKLMGYLEAARESIPGN